MLNFQSLQTPIGDSDLLIEPAASVWPELIAHNRRLPRAGLHLAGMPVDDLREQVRHDVLGAHGTEVVIASGHQPEFVHPGVWAKHVVVQHAAQQLGALGLDLVVDNDAPRSAGLLLPVIDHDGHVQIRSVPLLDAPPGSAYEGLPPLAPSTIDRWLGEIQVASVAADAPIDTYLRALRSLDKPADFVDQHLAGRAMVDELFGVSPIERRVRDVFGGHFVADLLLHADRFAAAYNEALHEYRREQNVRAPNRPLPDLRRENGRVETAFWIYRPMEPRRRLSVERHNDTLHLFAGVTAVGTLSISDLMRGPAAVLVGLGPWRVRPRALTLTLWARLLVCDLFVHGIGGAKYDRISDGIFQRYFGCEPPAFACVSATLRLPLPADATDEGDVARASQKLRDVHCNPDRHLQNGEDSLVRRKNAFVQQSEAMRANGAARHERRETFLAIRQINQRLNEEHPDLARTAAETLETLRQQVASNRVARHREYFYALHARSRLQKLADRLRDAATATPVRPT